MAYTPIAIENVTYGTPTIVSKTIVGSGLTGTAAYELYGATGAGYRDEDLQLLITNDGATGICTVYQGDYVTNSIGALNITVGGGVTKAVRIDGARFRQNTGSLYVGVGFTGSLYAYQAA